MPPVMYAVFLEQLLAKIALPKQRTSHRMVRTALLWLHFPTTMWRTWRTQLRGRLPTDAEQPNTASEPTPDTARRARRLGDKRLAFEKALAEQVRSGDLRVFSTNRRTRNTAAYQATASLDVPLSKNTARRYVVDALPRLRQTVPTLPVPCGDGERGSDAVAR